MLSSQPSKVESVIDAPNGEVKHHSKTAMIVTLTVNIVGLMLIFGSVTHFNRNLVEVQESYSRVQALHGKVLRIDEILTMSCWVASTTSDERWHARYESYVPVLDQTLKELFSKTPESVHKFIQETNAANAILVRYESQALQASKENNRAQALAFLTSVEYTSQKERYSRGMRQLDSALQKYFQGLLESEYKQIQQRELLIFIVIFGLAIFWIVIFRTASNWQRSTREYLSISSRLKRSLQERLADNLQLVEERSLEVKNLRRALLQSEQQERKRLGRLVHDDLQQLIAALRLKSSMYRDSAKIEHQKDSYQELVNLADEALTSTRDLVMRLTPPGEHHNSLTKIISAISKQFKLRYNLDVAIDTEHFVEPKQIEVSLLISRSIRELLFNIVKHAQVNKAEVKLWSLPDY